MSIRLWPALAAAEWFMHFADATALPDPDRIELTEAGAIFHFDNRESFGLWCERFDYSPVGHTRLTAEFKVGEHNVSGVHIKAAS